MNRKKKIYCTVTNDLNYDQRMIRICSSLTEAGYDVTLVGWQWPSSQPLVKRPFNQKRLFIPFRQGKIMYLFYWFRLFFFLLRQKADVFCAIDLDSIVPVYWASKLKKVKRLYDAHEIFTEMQEVNRRPKVKRLWEWIGKKYIPEFTTGYTISPSYADFFEEKYGVRYGVVRNATVLKPFRLSHKTDRFILYQGAVNVGRAFEYLIPAMQYVDIPLWIIGKGNFSEQVEALVDRHNLRDKVKILGYKRPDELRLYTEQAWVGVTLFDDSGHGLSNYLSMANRYFDYMHHGVPQLACNFPEYRRVNAEYEIAYLVNTLEPEKIAEGLNRLIHDSSYHQRLSENAMAAREKYCWQEEEKTLLSIYKKVLD